MSAPLPGSSGSDFTIAIIPDPQYLAASCAYGAYYAAMMQWIVNNRNMMLTSSQPFTAKIKAVIGVGDCVNSGGDAVECSNAQAAWKILDRSAIAFTTPPGNHDYMNEGPSSRSNLEPLFATGYFSAGSRSSVYGSGIDLGEGDVAHWVGSFDSTGANTAVKFVISGIKMLVLAMDFYAGSAAWSWAYDVAAANFDCECYITTHAWLRMYGTQFQRTDNYGPQSYSMAEPPYSNSPEEAWTSAGVSSWPNLFGIFGGHDLDPSSSPSPAWYWQRTPIASASRRGQTVQQFYANSQNLDRGCSATSNLTTGAGQVASVFLLSRRPELRLLEGRMISTQSGNWFQTRPESFPSGGDGWSLTEKLLFSIPFEGLQRTHADGASAVRPPITFRRNK